MAARCRHRDFTIRGERFASVAEAEARFGISAARIRKHLREGRADEIGQMPRHPSARPVTIRGVTYPSAEAAASALGVAANTVRAARRKGTLHRVGTGAVGVEPMPVRIRGVVYADARAAAEALGVALGTVRAAVSKGCPDQVGRQPEYRPWKSKPVTVGPFTFPSSREASRQLGFDNPGFVGHVLRTRSKRGWQRVLAAAMRLAREQERARGGAARDGVRIGPMLFASRVAAAAALGCSRADLDMALSGASVRRLRALEARAEALAAGPGREVAA